LIYLPWIIQFGALFIRCYIVTTSKRLSETSPQQLLGHDQPKTNQRFYWPVVWTIAIDRSFSQWPHSASISLFSDVACCCKLQFCHNLPRKCRRYWRFL